MLVDRRCRNVSSDPFLSDDLFARSLPPDRSEWPKPGKDHTLRYVVARGRRFESSVIATKVSRLGAIALYLSVATGLVINFPSPWLAGAGRVAAIAAIV